MIALKSPCPITYTSRKAELNNSRPVKCHCESTISLTQIYPLVFFLFVLNFCLFVCLFFCFCLIFVISFLFRFVLTSVINHVLAYDYNEGDYF